MVLSKSLTIFVVVAFSISVSLINNGVEAFHKIYPHLQSVSAVSVSGMHRTGYHFQPPRNWINGPMFYNGVYHLFYQYNPNGSVWGNIVWAHSISKDLINWKALEPAIYPSKPFDKYGCWSGSATILPGKGPVILYTGIIDENQTQVQCYAKPEDPSDPFLRKWVKPDEFNPIVVAGKGVNGSAFRDPTTAWWSKDGHWRILVGSRRKHRGMAYLYRSRDFFKWVRAKHPIHSAKTGMWECPDFYPVSLKGKEGLDTSMVGTNVKHVLKNSLDMTRFEYYTLGTYFMNKDKYIPDNTSEDGWGGLRYDYGNFYASKSFFDPSKNRRILWGWANESDSKDDDIKKGWAGIQAIPRSVWLDSTGRQLVQWPVEELNSLREREVNMNNHKLEKGDHIEVDGITAAQADVEVTFSFTSLDKAEAYDPSWVNAQDLCAQKGSKVEGGVGPFGLLTLASENLEEFTPVFFRIFKAPDKHVVLLCSDARSSSLKSNLYKPPFAGFVDVDLEATKKLSLRSLIDHSVVESFAEGGKTNILSRVYPQLAVTIQAHLCVFNNGTEPIIVENLKAWSMKSAEII
ncbi:beta-fructofuranosidase, insoluble isoenzyme 1-like isoform X1 [Lotus japonicus]|uniref:beta-fructofuranosidase, insoluble isoenzyme 1-like isoform X1 n=1 Tax=Lotus japonicus TaxID=34305 RepID=UPI002583E903|nr:beta-fructofuranosidase, insoluble isoenzyme 1-like isoform X1 [Lotus japonicus]XP_057438111.1 beta-fructofuranosidase, insoluble isoenzyme 1-like isoform X1 [Lotus japonicus]